MLLQRGTSVPRNPLCLLTQYIVFINLDKIIHYMSSYLMEHKK